MDASEGQTSGSRPPKRHVGTLLNAAAMIVILAGVSAAQQIVVPLLLAIFLATLSSPLINLLVDRKVPRLVAVLTIVLAQLGVLIGASLVITSSVNRLTDTLPTYQRAAVRRLSEITVWLSEHGVDVSEQDVTSAIDPSSIFGITSSVLSGFAGVASAILLVLLVSAFMLLEAPSIHAKCEAVLGRWLTNLREDPLKQATTQVQRYLAVKTATSGATGVLLGVYVGLWDLELALFWGFLAFLFNFVPTVGSILAAIPPIILGWLLIGPAAAFGIGAGYLIVNMVIGNIIEPRTMGVTLGLSPSIILVSLVFWGWLLGPVGALLSAPLTMIVKIVCAHIDEWRWVADVLGGGNPEDPEDTGVRTSLLRMK